MSDEDPKVRDEERPEETREEVVGRREDTDLQPERDDDAEDRAGQEAGSAVIDQRIEEVKRKAEEMAEREKA